MIDNAQELQDHIEMYAENLFYLDTETESSEIINMLILRDDIEELLQVIPASVAVAINIRLLELDRELVEKKLYVVDVIRDMGQSLGKPITHWWWYLDLATEEQKVAS